MQRIASLDALILGVVGAIAMSAISVVPAAAFTNNWSGAYIGAHLGGARQSGSDWTYFNPNNGASFSLTPGNNLRAAGGLKGCYNWRLAPRWLLGIESDISWTSLAHTRMVPTIGLGSFATMSATDHWLASVRGRVGFIGWSKTLCYGPGGEGRAQ